jgi:hypothetical protein
MTKRYIVEVYRPGSTEEVWEKRESDTPLMLPRVEIITPVSWPDGKPGDEVVVTSVSHSMWRSGKDGEVKQKTLIFTKNPAKGR